MNEDLLERQLTIRVISRIVLVVQKAIAKVSNITANVNNNW